MKSYPHGINPYYAWNGDYLQIGDMVQVLGGIGKIVDIYPYGNYSNAKLDTLDDQKSAAEIVVKLEHTSWLPVGAMLHRNYRLETSDYIRKVSQEEVMQYIMEL